MGLLRNCKHTDQEFLDAVEKSVSIAESLKRLGLKPAGGNYHCFRKKAKLLNADTSHFLGQGHNRGKRFGPKRPIESYLSNEFPIGSDSLRKRLISENVLPEMCNMCGRTQWLDQKIPLELDHIDGDNENNNLSNLRILCPNCHALTPTYRGKNISKA